tara:strand:+ start:1663 stop:2322 length:660 start_codon:yes stop_codon:yes gene_type:complete
MRSDLYDEWIVSLFDHDEAKGDWRWQDDAELLDIPKEFIADYIIQLNQDMLALRDKYNKWQLVYGLDAVYNVNCADYIFDFRDGPSTTQKKVEVIRSLKELYSECFFKLCRPLLGHLSEQQNELEGFCYMFWDLTPLHYFEENKDKEILYKEVSEVIEFALTLDSFACQESALHGLGHLIIPEYYPKAKDIIQNYIDRNINADPRIVKYAQAAKTGMIQ